MTKTEHLNPIGIFDSGLGGLSILKEIHKQLPKEKIIYLADSQNAPYGEKSQAKILEYSIQNTEFLISKGCKLIVVACNTATTNAINVLRKKFDRPFIGIEPAIKPASIQSKTGQIGILATRGTLASHLFHKNAKEISKKTKIIEVVGCGIVEAIENDTVHTLEFEKLLANQLQPFIDNDIDYLVLGCSHYPFIISKLKAILDEKVNIIDSGYAVAKQTQRILKKNKLNKNNLDSQNHIEIFTNGTSKNALNTILRQLHLKHYIIH
mgnify:CR=1 FL=1